MKRNLRLAFALGSICLPALFPAASRAQEITGITTADQVFTIGSAVSPGFASGPISITGMAAGMSVVGSDYRPNTGELYILGYNPVTTAARLYILNPQTGGTIAVGAADIMLSLGNGSIGFDFNPTVDRIRVVAANGANYRLHPVTGAIAFTDGNLNYVAGDANSGTAPSVGAVAYTNSYIGTETTTLYDLDEELNIIARQNPPNSGGLETIGSTGIDLDIADQSFDMDIYTNPATGANTAYLAASTEDGFDNLYTVNLTTGAATLVGGIGTGVMVKDIAVVIDRELAPVTGNLAFGLTRVNRNLIQFDTDQPGTIRSLRAVTGMVGGQRLVAIDVRPATLKLYGLGYNDTTQTYSLYTIDTATGVATAIGTPGNMNVGGGRIGFDFNPMVDRIRVVSSTDSNYRLHPETGLIVAYDMPLAYAAGDVNAGDNPNIGSVAYTNPYKFTTSTTLYGIDDTSGAFVSIAPPNNGTINTIAAAVITPATTDLTSDLDVYYDSTSSTNRIYLAANTGASSNDRLYKLSTTGMPVDMGAIGTGVQIMDIAMRLDFTGAGLSIGNTPSAANMLEVYPNPADGLLNIRVKGGTAATAVLVDITGAVVRTAATDTAAAMTMDVQALAPGIYFAQVTTDGIATAPVKIIKR